MRKDIPLLVSPSGTEGQFVSLVLLRVCEIFNLLNNIVSS